MLKTNLSYFSQPVKVLLFFTAITFIAYLPFTSMLFALKNDAFTGYFPPKFFMSESIHAGYWPLWNPYINYGIPQYGDMSSAFWSPLTWLIASTIGYNAYTFTIEEAFYILVAGLGMYKLLSYWEINRNIRLMAGVSYMCCGYFVGHLQHFNWISGAALLPWCLYSYLSLTKQITLKNIFKTGLSFLFFISSAHPGLIIGLVYFFLFVLIFIIYNHLKRNRPKPSSISTLIKSQIIFILIVPFFCLGIILGYLEVLPFIERGDKISLASALAEPTTLQSWLSLLLPFSVNKNPSFFANDIAMRNCYIGLPFLLALIHLLISPKNNWQKFFLLVSLLFFLLSLGSVFKKIAYHYSPFIGYVRLNGEFRIFTLFAFIIAAALQMNKAELFYKTPKFKIVYYFVNGILLFTITFSLINILAYHNSFLYNTFIYAPTFRLNLKQLVTQLTFYDALFIQSIIQFYILRVIYKNSNSEKLDFVKHLFVVEIVIATLLNIPFTGVGKVSAFEVQSVYNKSPKGIPIPSIIPTKDNSIMPEDVNKTAGDWSFYNKQIGTVRQIAYPINLKTSAAFFSQQTAKEISLKTPIFAEVADSNISTFRFINFSPELIEIESLALNKDISLVLKQNYYPKWSCMVNNVYSPINIKYDSFMSIQVPKNETRILFEFKNHKVQILIIWTLLCAIISLIFLFLQFYKKRININ